MSEQEFDRYLALLTKLLRLRSGQREEIAEELRDHLEQRLEELTAQGVPHDEAVRSALEEFGDAANLAHHFSHLSHVRYRRQTMRRALGTIAVITVVLLIAIAFWPHIPVPVPPAPQFIVAQAAGSPAAGGAMGSATTPEQAALAAEQNDKAKVEQVLSRKIAVEFVDTPLTDAILFIKHTTNVPFFLDTKSLQVTGVAIDSPVSIQFGPDTVTLRTILELILEPLQLGYTIRGGIIYITTVNRANEIVVYNVRDLLTDFSGLGGAMPGMAAMGGAASADPNMPGVGSFGPAGGHGLAGGEGAMFGHLPRSKGEVCFKLSETPSLPVVVAAMIEPASWETNGGSGNITQYNGLMVVKNSQTVHAKIRRLLEMMRAAAREPAQ